MLLGALRKHERWWVGQGELCTLPEKSHSLGGSATCGVVVGGEHAEGMCTPGHQVMWDDGRGLQKCC